jgi:hypothetical protein
VVSVLKDAGLRETLVARGLERAQAFSRERYEAGLTRTLEENLGLSVQRAVHEPGGGQGVSEGGYSPVVREGVLLEAISQAAMEESDVAMRGYQVRSKAPLVGPLIAWVRRNLTSHLREPYLDLIVERQVLFNRRVSAWLERATETLHAHRVSRQELLARIEALETQVEQLRRQIRDEEG